MACLKSLCTIEKGVLWKPRTTVLLDVPYNHAVSHLGTVKSIIFPQYLYNFTLRFCNMKIGKSWVKTLINRPLSFKGTLIAKIKTVQSQ